MKKIFLLVLFCVNLYSYSQTHDHVYSYTRPRANMYNGNSFTLNGFSSCQNGLIVTIPTFNQYITDTYYLNPCDYGNFLRVYVDDNLIASNLCQGSVVSVPPQFLPVTNIKIEFYHTGPGASWSPDVQLKTEITVTSPIASMPVTPNTSNINYSINATATPLSATLAGTGTSLKWYTAQTGGLPSTTAPTPSTATVGTTSYWVSQADASGCESERVEIVVTVNAPATHLNFDGTNDFVNVPNSSSLAFGTGNLTLEAMVKMSAAQGGYSGIITKATSTGFVGIQFVVVNNKIALEFGNGTMLGTGAGLIGTTNLNDNIWHHVACVVDRANNNIKLYVDGIVEANVTNALIGTANITTTTPLFIGKERNSNEFLESNIDEVRIWNVALSQADIQNTMNCEAQSQPELVAYYKFNQGFNNADNTAITTLIDETGNSNGTLTNFALTGTTSNWQSGSTITTGDTCATLSTTGFEAISSLKVYPNPSTGIFNIATQEDVTVEVYDLVGKAIVKKAMTVGSNSIDISNYASGMYLLKATNASGKTNTYKIVKQ